MTSAWIIDLKWLSSHLIDTETMLAWTRTGCKDVSSSHTSSKYGISSSNSNSGITHSRWPKAALRCTIPNTYNTQEPHMNRQLIYRIVLALLFHLQQPYLGLGHRVKSECRSAYLQHRPYPSHRPLALHLHLPLPYLTVPLPRRVI